MLKEPLNLREVYGQDRVVQDLKGILKRYYKEQSVVTPLLYPERRLNIKDIYINLVMIKEEEMKEREKALKKQKEIDGDDLSTQLLSPHEQIYGEKTSIDPSEIFKEDGETNVFVPAIFLDIYSNTENSNKTLKLSYICSSVGESTWNKYTNYINKLVKIVNESASEK